MLDFIGHTADFIIVGATLFMFVKNYRELSKAQRERKQHDTTH